MPRPPASGRSRRSASESRCSSSARLPRHVLDLLDPVAEPEPLGELAVGRAQAADEARDDVAVDLGQRGQERPRVAMPEERPRVRDPEALAPVVLELLEVLEVAAVRDRLHPLRPELAHLARDRVRDGDDGVRPARDELRHGLLRLLLHAHGEPVDPAVRVRGHRVAEVGDPVHACHLLDRGADQVDRGGRRGGHEDVDLLVADDPARGRNRGQAPADELVRHEQPPREEAGLAQGAVETVEPVQLLGRQAPLGPDVLRAVHLDVRRDRELVVAVEPLRVVGREHVHLEAEVGQMTRRASSAARRRRRRQAGSTS